MLHFGYLLDALRTAKQALNHLLIYTMQVFEDLHRQF
jgi:hypothetical protein